MKDQVKCPRCDQVHSDLHEFGMGDDDFSTIECDCGWTFKIHCQIRVAYAVVSGSVKPKNNKK